MFYVVDPTPTQYQDCPQCQAQLPVYAGYETWCETCGWNLKIPSPSEPKRLFDKLYASIGQKSSRKLHAEMLKRPPSRARFSPARLLALIIAACVNGLLAAFFGLGTWLLGFAFPEQRWLGIVLGLGCYVMLVVFWRPCFPQPDGWLLPRSEYPQLYRLANRVAKTLGGPRVERIYYDIQYNAAYGRLGWLRKRSLVLGLPLLASLNQQELVALIGHELAHDANGDPSSGAFIGTALYSLGFWYELVHPYQQWHRFSAPLTLMINVLGTPISGLIWVVGYALSQLLWYDMQRAEYLADWLAARVGGTEAFLSVLNKCLLRERYENALKFAYLNQGMHNFYAGLKEQIEGVPQREIARLRRIEEGRNQEPATTHPPVLWREAYLKAHAVPQSEVVLSPSEAVLLERELAPLLAQMQQQIAGLDEMTFREAFGVGW